MARLTDMTATLRESLESLDCPEFQNGAFVPPRPLKQCRVALISSAGLMKRKDDNISGGSADYSTIEHTWPDRDLLINHISVNFDRTAFAEDINSVFPREILGQLAEEGIIEQVSARHYSFMGSTAPDKLRPNAEKLAQELIKDGINTVCLLPV